MSRHAPIGPGRLLNDTNLGTGTLALLRRSLSVMLLPLPLLLLLPVTSEWCWT